MFDTLVNLLFGGKQAKSRQEQEPNKVRNANSSPSSFVGKTAQTSGRSKNSYMPPRNRLSSPAQSGSVKSSSYWVHGNYAPAHTANIQQHLNMFYAPVARNFGASADNTNDMSFDPNKQSDSIASERAEAESADVNNFFAEKQSRQAEILREISNHPDEMVRLYVAQNFKTPEPGLRILAQDSSRDVKLALVANSRCPFDVLESLMEDSDELVSFEARRRLSNAGRCVDRKTA